KEMKLCIVGTVFIGSVLAHKLAEKGHHVSLIYEQEQRSQLSLSIPPEFPPQIKHPSPDSKA
ncbi:hypothetical protein, partial [Acetobacter sp.]|uniref:hypothetical protein n=1 Tax=Acetobacter sp. TaxID=440 RepID=UPI0039EB0E4F